MLVNTYVYNTQVYIVSEVMYTLSCISQLKQANYKRERQLKYFSEKNIFRETLSNLLNKIGETFVWVCWWTADVFHVP